MEEILKFVTEMKKRAKRTSVEQKQEEARGGHADSRSSARSSSSVKGPVSLVTSGRREISDHCGSPCMLCSGNHLLQECREFHNMAIRRRKDLVMEERLCFSCFSRAHRAIDCPQRTICGIAGCTRRHSPLIHTREQKQDRGGRPREENRFSGPGLRVGKRERTWATSPNSGQPASKRRASYIRHDEDISPSPGPSTSSGERGKTEPTQAVLATSHWDNKYKWLRRNGKLDDRADGRGEGGIPEKNND